MPSVMFHLSEPLKDTLGLYAQAHHKSISEVIREAVARHIDYDLSQDKRTRRTKYATPQERESAKNLRARERRSLARKLVNAQTEAEIKLYREALQASLRQG